MRQRRELLRRQAHVELGDFEPQRGQRQARLVEAMFEVVAEIRAHHRLARQVHREHGVGIRPALAIALHPDQQRANDPTIDGRHAPMTLGRVEKIV